MNAAKQALTIFFALLLITYAGWYFARSTASLKQLDDSLLSQSADALAKDLTVWQFDEKGRLINYLHAPEMHHIPKENTHFFKNPQVILQQPGEPVWQIRAGRATAIHAGEQITFLENVVVHQNKGAHTEESTMKTEQLVYYPKKKLALSRLAVIFEQPGTLVHSQGVNIYLAEKRVQLLGQARARYEPKHG